MFSHGPLARTCIPWVWTSQSFDTGIELEVYGGSGKLPRTPKQFDNDPTVNLVVATIAKDDISWTSHITIPNMAIVRYISDDETSRFHPSKPLGRESLMYFTYMQDFYDSLPDISIFIHADESPWHVESILQNNLSYALNRLNLNHVQKRKYVNLRVDWKNACPDWINTTHTEESEMIKGKEEEIFMHQAFVDNFRPWYGDSSADNFSVPEILAQPCCNQFAVTGDIIRSIPLVEYRRFMEWLTTSSVATSFVADWVVGRFWEHSFQYLFTGKAVDCPNQWKAWCLVYGICFESEGEMYQYLQGDSERGWLVEEMEGWGILRKPVKAWNYGKKLRELNTWLETIMKNATARSKEWKWKASLGNLYSEWADGEVLLG